MSKCTTCLGSSWVLADTSRGLHLTPCYTCKRAGRKLQVLPPRLFQLLPEQHGPLIRRAMARTLETVQLAPGKLMPNTGKAVLEYAASYALTGSAECLERLEEIRVALEKTPAEPDPKPQTHYDVTGLTFRPCRSCRKPIAFTAPDSGRYTPVETDGQIHWINCPGAREWRKSA